MFDTNSSALQAGIDLGKSWDFSDFSTFQDGFCARVFLSDDMALKVPVQGEEITFGARAALALEKANVGAKVYRADLKTGVLLMERLDPGTSLGLSPGDELFARPIFIEFIKQIRLIESEGLCPLERYFYTANPLAEHLIKTTKRQVFLHGDLHHGNVLLHHGKWVVIDAKGVFGDSAYEAVAFVRNPLEWIGEVDDLKTLTFDRIHYFAEELDEDPSRIWAWCLADMEPKERGPWQRLQKELRAMAPSFVGPLDLPPGTLPH